MNVRNKIFVGLVLFSLALIGIIRYSITYLQPESQLSYKRNMRKTVSNYRILTNKTIARICGTYNLQMNLSHYDSSNVGPTESDVSSGSSSMSLAKLIQGGSNPLQ